MEEGGEKGNPLVRDLWTQGTDRINNMRVVDTDAVSYQSKTQEKCPRTGKRKKKRNYINDYLD